MLLKKLMSDVEARGGVSKAFQLILAASLLTNMFMAGAFFTMDRTVRTILTPPEINKSFWVDGRTLSPEYLEEMGSWVVQQYATVTPSSSEYQFNKLLRYVHPSVHGDLAIRFTMGTNRLKADNISKFFMPREVRISEKGKSIAFIGSQSTWIADKRLPNDEIKAFLVKFSYDGSRTFIEELRETSVTKPFDPPVTQPSMLIEDEFQTGQHAGAGATAGGDVAPKTATSGSYSTLSGMPPAPAGSNQAAKETLESGQVPAATLDQ